MSPTRHWMIGVTIAVALVAGCAESDEGDDASPTTSTAPTSETTALGGVDGGTTTDPVEGNAAALQWGLDYTGGPGGEASGEPIRVGFANNTSFFPETADGAELAMDFINEELGGIDGRPLDLVSCQVEVAEDGAGCGAEFANDDGIVLAIAGALLTGNEEFYAALSGIRPTYTLGPLAVADYTTTDSVSYTSGALGAGMGGGVFVAEELRPERAALIVTDDAAGRGAAPLLEPVLNDAGIELVSVFVPPTATAPEIESAIQSIDPDSVDSILIGLFEQGCIAAYDALRNLGIDARERSVSTTSACWGSAMQEHTANSGESGILPDGWYFTNPLGYNLFEPDLDSGVDTFRLALEGAGEDSDAPNTVLAGAFAGIMSMARHLNSVDGDYTFDALTAAIREFEGPAMLQAGPLTCGAPPVFKGVCSTRISAHRYIDGEWDDVRAGDDLIDISPILIGEDS